MVFCCGVCWVGVDDFDIVEFFGGFFGVFGGCFKEVDVECFDYEGNLFVFGLSWVCY